jgi:hypothetical protein
MKNPNEQMVLIEAEAFDCLGGWVVDQQFMDALGSPFLLAHGLGKPVDDAVTTVHLPAPGEYRVWVRTRDWVAPWDAPGAPGKFQLIVDGQALDATFGTEGAEWHWQDGGTVEVEEGAAELALHDLTGFEGRCDAILLCRDLDFEPPDGGDELAALRDQLLGTAEPQDMGEFDLVVCGAGLAGVCAALTAARKGLTVALVQDRPVPGGNNSSEVRVWCGGQTRMDPYPHIGDIVAELEPENRAHYGPGNTGDLYEDDARIGLLEAEPNLAWMPNLHVTDVHTDEDRITGIIARHTRSAAKVLLRPRWVLDSTGHADIGALAGADFEMTMPGHMGRCNLWHVVDTGEPTEFPECPWAFDLSDKPFPGREEQDDSQFGVWYWESGFSHDPIAEGEYIRDTNFRAMYGAWDALKNVDGAFPTHRLGWAAYISGPRESRRLLGDVVIDEEDILEWREFEDACVPCTWKIDVHRPDPEYQEGFEGDEFISLADFTDYDRPWWLPYRCLYSRNVSNLFMAGRNVSVTHQGLGAVRVMRTTGMMGEVVGLAASLCAQHDADPRDLYESHLEDLKAALKAGPPTALPE